MKTIAELRAQGFRIQKATDAVDCTEVAFDGAFHCYNGRHVSMVEVMLNMKPALPAAQAQDSTHRMVFAGVYNDTDVFPWVLLPGPSAQRVIEAFQAHMDALKQTSDTERQFKAALQEATA